METIQGNGNLGATIVARRVSSVIARFFSAVKIRRKQSNLRLCETLALGERRFLALVQWEGKRYLIGVAQNSFSVLDRAESSGASSEFPGRFVRGPQERGE